MPPQQELGVHLGLLGVRVEWEWVDVDEPDELSMVSLSGTIGFQNPMG